jgi:hypothetical protein
MAIEVHVPNKAYNGVLGGVHFRRGVGIFENEVKGKELASEFGFEVVETAAAGPVEEAEPAVEEKPKRKPRKKKAVSKEAE